MSLNSGGISGLFAVLHKKDPVRYRYLLWLKYLTFNGAALAFVILAYLAGWVGLLFGKDPKATWLDLFSSPDPQVLSVSVILLTFFFGLVLSTNKAYLLSREINFTKDESPQKDSRMAEYLRQIHGADSGSREISRKMLEARWFSRMSLVREIQNILVILGLIGTVIGIIIALSGVRPDSVGDVSAVGPMVATLIKGMAIALNTTLAGSVLGAIWIRMNYHILRVGSVNLITAIVERGERMVVSGGKNG